MDAGSIKPISGWGHRKVAMAEHDGLLVGKPLVWLQAPRSDEFQGVGGCLVVGGEKMRQPSPHGFEGVASAMLVRVDVHLSQFLAS